MTSTCRHPSRSFNSEEQGTLTVDDRRDEALQGIPTGQRSTLSKVHRMEAKKDLKRRAGYRPMLSTTPHHLLQ